ncbi:MAG: dihydrolipoyl dehydrogenase [Planctomycetes bacterium]|nr:dihydrolipoyl dehydrogenase [Planctomycetota bacterium]
MATHTFDVCVIGSGPGGYVAAIRAAQLGLKTCCVEDKHFGGICLNWGCIPTKALLKSAEVFHTIQHKAKTFGIAVEKANADMAAVVKRSRDISGQLNKGIQFLFKKHGVSQFSGRGRIAGKGVVEVTEPNNPENKPDRPNSHGKVVETINAKHIIVATGARPRRFPNMPVDGKRIIGHHEALVLAERPKKVVVIGAGAIGVEFSYYFHAFGAEVTLIELMDRIVPVEDDDSSRELEKAYKKLGISVQTESKVENVSATASGVKVVYERKGKKTELEVDYCLVAVGIQGNVEDLGLEAAGVKVERGFIPVDGYGRTNVAGIYAIGDVAGQPALAHKASHEGLACVEKIAGHDVKPFSKDIIPGCTYSQPQVASVGKTERALKEAGIEYKVGKFPFKSLGKAMAMGDNDGFVKLLFDKKYGQLLGAHIVHGEATELISELVLGMDVEAVSKTLIHAVHPHPTLSEAVMEAAALAEGECVHM